MGDLWVFSPSSGLTAGAFDAVVFNTSLNDMSLIANDIKLSNVFDGGASGKWSPAIGLYSSKQNVGLTWSFNQYTINTINGGIALKNSSITQWGNCCTRDIDADYTTISPYASLGWEIGNLNADVSIRRDNQDASGNYSTASATGGLGSFVTRNKIDYSIGETSYSGRCELSHHTKLRLVLVASVEDLHLMQTALCFGASNLNGGGDSCQ